MAGGRIPEAHRHRRTGRGVMRDSHPHVIALGEWLWGATQTIVPPGLPLPPPPPPPAPLPAAFVCDGLDTPCSTMDALTCGICLDNLRVPVCTPCGTCPSHHPRIFAFSREPRSQDTSAARHASRPTLRLAQTPLTRPAPPAGRRSPSVSPLHASISPKPRFST